MGYAEGSATSFGPQRAGTRPLCHFEPFHTLTRPGISAKSNHSRTSKKFSRKSNDSRTYAKTGGWGLTFQLSTGHLAKDAHPERAARAEGSLRLLPLFSMLASRMPAEASAEEGRSSLATHSNHSRTIGNRCPTSRTCSKSYHYIKYPCRRADNFVSGTHHGKRAIPGSPRTAFFQLPTVNSRL